MDVPADLRYTANHLWVRQEADGTVTTGVTDYLSELVGEITLFDLSGCPEPGNPIIGGQEIGGVVGTKSSAQLYAPVIGLLTDTNRQAASDPGVFKDGCYQVWLYKFTPEFADDLEGLMDADRYRSLIEASAGAY